MLTIPETNELTLRSSITQKINLIFNDDEYTFEAFILMKGDHTLKKFVLYEGAPQRRSDTSVNFKKKLQLSIAESIRRKFADESAEYDHANNIANNQNKFYVIPQTTDYSPFAAVCTTIQTYDSYRVTDRENAEGIFFRYQRGEQIIWAYQYFWPNAIPNRKGLAFHVIPQDDVFTELKKPILAISQKVDLLIIDNNIITNDINLLQTHYDFEHYIRVSARSVASEITTLSLVSNMDKVADYISRSKLTYAKKMLRIKNSKVLTKSKEELYLKITTLPRWSGKFDLDEETHTIVLRNYGQVENLIDLLDERYTRSDVTDEEYDTSAKKWVEPASQ